MKLEAHERCPYCKETHKVTTYALAHWNESQVIQCADCGKRYTFNRGRTYKLTASLAKQNET